MAAGHGDRLDPVDAALLGMESPTLPMHVGGLLLFDAAGVDGFTFPRLVELVRSRLDGLPRYRQKLRFAPLQLTTPRWVDDAEFDLGYHVRHAALPQPGRREQLTEYCTRVLSRPLDRDRPLWELYLIEGLADGRVAVLAKSHSVMVDGLTGMDIATVLLDADPEASATIPAPGPWEPEEPPMDHELAWSAVTEMLTSPLALASTLGRAMRSPTAALRRAADVGRGLVSLARSGVGLPAPRTVLNRPPGAHRRLALHDLDVAEVRAIKDAYGTTVNAVVLALVADATGRYLRHRGVTTDGLWLRVMVPISVRSEGAEHALGNRVVSALVPLPMFEMDPAERLEVCQRRMEDLSERHQAVGAEFLIDLARFAPPTLHAMASRAASRSRVFSFLVVNVPGPREPVYCLGAELDEVYPFTPLSQHQCYAVGVVSVAGRMCVAVTADYDALPDVDRVPGMLTAALEDLQRSAAATTTRAELAGRDPGELETDVDELDGISR